MLEPPRTSEPPQTTALQGLQGVQGAKGTGSRRFDEVRCAVLYLYTTLEMKPPPNKPFSGPILLCLHLYRGDT